ncbi:MAG: membrane protein insertion efficiency factor YidD [Staphylococcus sp.]|jgi:hypothetical protein|nr:membrane protein insertion efficiency factor YidD [Staphylococcus sp.]
MLFNKWAIKLIKLYQKDKDRPHRCRHLPSCSNYGLECFEKFNFIKASFLTGYRILRCNPLNHKVFDPVPLSKKEKKIEQSYQKKASIIDEELIKIVNDNKHLNLEQQIDNLITMIWENHFGLIDEMDVKKIKNDDVMLFYAKIDRILILIKKKKILLNYKSAKKYVENYLFSDVFKHPKYFINNKNIY